jgi:hypothetical protein
VKSLTPSPAAITTTNSNDGGAVARITDDDQVKILDASGALVHDFESPHGPISAADITSDGRRLVTCGRHDNAIRFWDATSWREVATFRMSADIKALEFTPNDSLLIVSFIDGHVETWDARPYSERQQSNYQRTELELAKRRAEKCIEDLLANEPDHYTFRESIANDESLNLVQSAVIYDTLEKRFQPLLRQTNAAWQIVRAPGRSKEEVRKALDDARRLAAIWPGYDVLKVIGAAHYRLGQFQEALSTLERIDEPLSQRTPLFMAMAAWQLGDHERAKKLLEEAHARRKRAGVNSDSRARADNFQEAESLIGKPE